MAAHDLQEPLRMVSSYTKLLEKRYVGKLDNDADEFIAYAVDGASRMQTLIRDLLEYSRVGTKALQVSQVDVSEIVVQTIRNLKKLIDERHAQIVWDSLPTVPADPIRLTQVFQNLLANAIKFCDATSPPYVTVGAEQRETDWLFFVQDNGIGIEPVHLAKIFDVFHRLHNRKIYSGTGIGLAICKRIVEDHKGKIWVDSTPNKGSTFFFTLGNTEQKRKLTSKRVAAVQSNLGNALFSRKIDSFVSILKIRLAYIMREVVYETYPYCR